MKHKKYLKRVWADRTLILMTIPALVIIILFSYVPMTGLILAFKNFNFADGIYGSPWAGLDNFKLLFLNGKVFWRLTRNTIGYFLLFTVIGTICNVGLAILIYELVFEKFGKTVQSILILPTFISWVAVSYIVAAFLETNTGLINRLLISLGLDQIVFYLKSEYWPMILLFINIWKGTGYGSVLYLATLTGIDKNLYEAATIDGANKSQQRRYITIPMLLPMVTVMTLLSVGSVLHSDTGLFYQATRNTGALYETTQVFDSYILNAISGAAGTNYNLLSAITFFQSVVGSVLVVVTNLIVRKFSPENALF